MLSLTNHSVVVSDKVTYTVEDEDFAIVCDDGEELIVPLCGLVKLQIGLMVECKQPGLQVERYSNEKNHCINKHYSCNYCYCGCYGLCFNQKNNGNYNGVIR